MKTQYEAYKIGTEVWAIAEHYKDNKPTPYVAIFRAKVKTVNITLDEKTGDIRVDYWLSTLNGEGWGDDIPGHKVSTNINELIEYMKPIWEAASNSHE